MQSHKCAIACDVEKVMIKTSAFLKQNNGVFMCKRNFVAITWYDYMTLRMLPLLLFAVIFGGCVSGRVSGPESVSVAKSEALVLPVREGMLSIGDSSGPSGGSVPSGPSGGSVPSGSSGGAGTSTQSQTRAAEGISSSAPVQLYYRIVGDAPDTLVVLNGGSGMSYTYLYHDLLPLTARFTLVFYDQRSAGRSTVVPDIPGNNTDFAISDLEALRAHLGLRSMNLLGHSWGSLLAALYASAYSERVKTMIMVGSVGPAWSVYGDNFNTWESMNPELQPTLHALYDIWMDGDTDPLKACQDYWQVHLRAFYRSPEQARRQWGNVCNAPDESVRSSWGFVPYAMLMHAEFDFRELFSQITVPTLIIHGLDDPMPIVAAASWLETLPNAQLLRIPGAGHAPYVDNPRIFFPAVTAFASRFPDALPPQATAYQLLLDTLRRENQRLEKAILREDWDEAASVFAGEAVMLPPGGGPVWGQRAIASYWQAGYGKGMRALELETVEAERYGNVVVEIGKYAIFGENRVLVDAGKYQVFWRKTSDGWRIWRDTFNSSLEVRSPLEIPDYLPETFLRP
jgi:proline iminopeptidase